MKLDKRLVDKVISLTKMHYRIYDIDYLPALSEAEEFLNNSGASWPVVKLLGDLAQYTEISGKGTHEDIYKALEVFGITVEDKEKENE